MKGVIGARSSVFAFRASAFLPLQLKIRDLIRLEDLRVPTNYETPARESCHNLLFSLESLWKIGITRYKNLDVEA